MIAWIRFTITSLAAWFAIARLIDSQDRRIARIFDGSTANDLWKEKTHALASLKTAA